MLSRVMERELLFENPSGKETAEFSVFSTLDFVFYVHYIQVLPTLLTLGGTFMNNLCQQKAVNFHIFLFSLSILSFKFSSDSLLLMMRELKKNRQRIKLKDLTMPLKIIPSNIKFIRIIFFPLGFETTCELSTPLFYPFSTFRKKNESKIVNKNKKQSSKLNMFQRINHSFCAFFHFILGVSRFLNQPLPSPAAACDKC